MDPAEPDQRLRETFGPRSGDHGSRSPERPPRPFVFPRRLAIGIVGLLILVGGAAGGYALTPHEHVAPGCWWWSAAQVGDVTAGSRGCVRGYAAPGGWIAESNGQQGIALYYSRANPDSPQTRPDCPFRPGDAVVVRYHAVLDDGQTIVVIDDCR